MSDSAQLPSETARQSGEGAPTPPKEWPPTDPNDQSPYPYPEVLEDWRWLFDEVPTPRFDPYRGRFVAVFEKRVLGSGDDEPQLRQTVAAEHNLDPDRLVTMFIEGLD
jgi:hypothetical protein